MNLKPFAFIVTLFVFASSSTSAKIIYVPADSSTIQGGINGALGGDTVLVERGHYYERINFYGKGILVASNFIFDNDTVTIDSTIIDADPEILGRVDTGSVVCFVSGEDSSSKIVGFTLQNGYGLKWAEYHYGGGIICFSTCPQVCHNKIMNNTAYYGGGICSIGDSLTPLIEGNHLIENEAAIGGAILCERSFVQIMDNVIVDNHSVIKGGGIFFKICSPTIIDNYIKNNVTEGYGGGICGYIGSLTLLGNKIIQNSCMTKGGGLYCATLDSALLGNNLFHKNSAQKGGGIYSLNCSSLLFNNTLVENSSTHYGGGILCDGSVSHPIIVNNIIGFSLAGEGIRCIGSSSPLISNNCLWNNASGNFRYCPSGVGDTTWGVNMSGTPCDSFYNIIKNPFFVDSLNDFHLLNVSPCIDAGDNSIPADSDLDGLPRIVDGNSDDSAVVDMGAFEYQISVGIKDEEETSCFCDFAIFQNYPNPFNPQTKIEYYLAEPTWVRLTIYNAIGQKVKALVDNFQTAGNKLVIWDGKDNKGKTVASGIYFYKLEANGYVQSKKMILLK
jgi:predicted outer membrane repeat protein